MHLVREVEVVDLAASQHGRVVAYEVNVGATSTLKSVENPESVGV